MEINISKVDMYTILDVMCRPYYKKIVIVQ